MSLRVRRIGWLGLAMVLTMTGLVCAASARAGVVYDNIEPEARVENPVSLGYEATGTSEFGSQIAMTEAANEPEVEVLMSVWSCETGEWNKVCVTSNPAATFSAPLTLNVYEVGEESEPGELLESVNKTFALHYRPSSDVTCKKAGETESTRFRNANGVCNHGMPVPVTFKLAGSLPRRVIVSIAFNTSTAGYTPTPSGGPMDALNVALLGPPTVGQNPTEGQDGIYWATSIYFDKSNVFGYDNEEEWPPGESQIAARVITAGSSVPTGPQGPQGEKGATGATGPAGARGEKGAAGANGSGNSVALKRKMALTFVGGKATLSGGKVAVKVRCAGSEAKRCVGTLSLKVAGQTAKASYSVATGKTATIKVPLAGGQATTSGAATKASAVARTLQPSGGTVTTKRTLHLG